MSKRPTPGTGILVAVPKLRQRKVRLVEGKKAHEKGHLFLERLVYDESIRKWRVEHREPRDDLRKVVPFVVELIGDESNSEVEEYVESQCDPTTDAWFQRRERPDWERINKWINDEYERRRQRLTAQRQFALYVPGRSS